MFIDTHCHLFKEYYEDIDNLIFKIKSNNVEKVIVSGTNIENNKEILKLVDKYDGVYGALGFHPTELDNFKEEYYNFLEKNIDNPKIVAIGEIGLDYHYENTNKATQQEVFKRQIEIAKRHNKPVIIHSRDSIMDTYNILKESKIKGVIHCYSGSLEMAKNFIKIGFYLGIGGIITYKNAKNIIEVINNVPLEYILLETDSPYITPEPYRKEKNDPSYIPIIANKIAMLKNIDIKDVGIITTKNCSSIFDI